MLGYASFTAVYLLAGLAGSGASLVFSDAATVGASGAIFGLLGAVPALDIPIHLFETACQGRGDGGSAAHVMCGSNGLGAVGNTMHPGSHGVQGVSVQHAYRLAD